MNPFHQNQNRGQKFEGFEVLGSVNDHNKSVEGDGRMRQTIRNVQKKDLNYIPCNDT